MVITTSGISVSRRWISYRFQILNKISAGTNRIGATSSVIVLPAASPAPPWRLENSFFSCYNGPVVFTYTKFWCAGKSLENYAHSAGYVYLASSMLNTGASRLYRGKGKCFNSCTPEEIEPRRCVDLLQFTVTVVPTLASVAVTDIFQR